MFGDVPKVKLLGGRKEHASVHPTHNFVRQSGTFSPDRRTPNTGAGLDKGGAPFVQKTFFLVENEKLWNVKCNNVK